LDSRTIHRIKDDKKGNAIFQYNTDFRFGDGHDIYIKDKANVAEGACYS